MIARQMRELIASVEKHATGGEELRKRGRWTPDQSLAAIAYLAGEMRAVLDANRLAPGAKYALIPDAASVLANPQEDES